MSRIAISKAALNKKINLTSKLDLNSTIQLVKCCICSIDFYSTEAWILRKVDHKYLERFVMWSWRGI
jgi:hypothetical protein